MRLKRLTAPLVVIALALSLAACAAHQIKTAAIISDQVAQGLLTAQSATTEAYRVGALTQATYFSVQDQFERVARIGLAVDAALRRGDTAGAAVQVSAAADVVRAFLDQGIPQLSAAEQSIVRAVLVTLQGTLDAYAATLRGGA